MCVSPTCGASSSIRGPGYGDNLAAAIGLTGRQRSGLSGIHHSGLRHAWATPPRSHRFQDAHPGPADYRFALLVPREARLEVRRRIPRRRQRRNPRPGIGRQLHHQSADHRPAGSSPAPATRWRASCLARSTRPTSRCPTRFPRALRTWRSTRRTIGASRDRLTINDGLRWEVELPRRVVGNKMNSFDPMAINPVSGTPGVVTFAGVDGVPERAFATDWNNLGPRLGFAYRLPGKHETVIRGGGGIFYGPTVSNTIGDVASLGFSTSASYVGRPSRPAECVSASATAFPRSPARRSPRDSAPCHRPETQYLGGVLQPDQVAPISYQYNLNVQREIVERPAGGGRLYRPTSATT